MSSDTISAENRRGQQTLQEAAKVQLIYMAIRGIGLRVELPNDKCEEFLSGFRGTRYIVINLNDAQKVIDRDGDLRTVLDPYHIPVLTATEDDTITTNRKMDTVLKIYEAAQPAICVPDVSFTYSPDDEELTRQEKSEYIRSIAQAYVEYVKSLYEEVRARDYDVRLVPTQKGWEMEHFTPYRELREDYGITDYAFYCKQYVGGNMGNSVNSNIRHVQNFISAVGPDNVMLIGRSSPNELSKFPPRATFACGLNQWREASDTGSGYSHANCGQFITGTEPEILRNVGAVQQNLVEC